MSVLASVGLWLWTNTAGNLVASAMCLAIGYVWKVRPHLRAQAVHRKAEAVHRALVHAQLAELHHKHDQLHAKVDQLGI